MNTRDIPALGTMRERVQLQQKNMAIDAAGGHSEDFVALATVWARVTSSGGAFSAEADARSARISYTIVIRFRSDLKAGDRIIYRSNELEIISAGDLNGRRAYLSCKCSQIKSTG